MALLVEQNAVSVHLDQLTPSFSPEGNVAGRDHLLVEFFIQLPQRLGIHYEDSNGLLFHRRKGILSSSGAGRRLSSQKPGFSSSCCIKRESTSKDEWRSPLLTPPHQRHVRPHARGHAAGSSDAAANSVVYFLKCGTAYFSRAFVALNAVTLGPCVPPAFS